MKTIAYCSKETDEEAEIRLRSKLPKKYSHVPLHLLPETSSFRSTKGVKDAMRKIAKRRRCSLTKVLLSALKSYLAKYGHFDESLRHY